MDQIINIRSDTLKLLEKILESKLQQNKKIKTQNQQMRSCEIKKASLQQRNKLHKQAIHNGRTFLS